MSERRRAEITETVADLDGSKVLVIKADGEIVGVQNAETVIRRLANVGKIIADMDATLAMSDADFLKDAQKRMDGRIAGLEKRKAAFTAEGVTAAAKARLEGKRLGLVAQQTTLLAAVEAMAE